MRFIAVTVAASLLLVAPLLLVGWNTTSAFVLGLATLLGASVPAWSMLAGAVGASSQRKLRFSLSLLAFVLAFDLVAFLTGWQSLATNAVSVGSLRDEVLVASYQIVLIAGPVVTLALFAGKQPSVFWMSGRASARSH